MLPESQVTFDAKDRFPASVIVPVLLKVIDGNLLWLTVMAVPSIVWAPEPVRLITVLPPPPVPVLVRIRLPLTLIFPVLSKTLPAPAIVRFPDADKVVV